MSDLYLISIGMCVSFFKGINLKLIYGDLKERLYKIKMNLEISLIWNDRL